MLSIVIPTLNEESYLPKLLDSIKKQDYFDNYEIIVADANSKDNTVNIAKKYRSLVISGGLPAKGRNNGAKTANGDLILFLDADVILGKDFFKKSLDEFNKRKLDIASFLLIPISRGRFIRLLFNLFYNIPVVLMQEVLAHGAMGILIKKDLFEEIKGFDESIKLAEDHDLVRRAAKRARYGIIKSSKLLISDRRFIEDGWFITFFKYVVCELHMIFIGPVRSNIFRYRLGHYLNNKKDKL